ncbi:putative membrane protein [Lishizhenia tianjinensis]|uniref:Protoporphyrinogen IX oxidase n=1 Tax=Lishizhenia tianjinensis TaxID=477690 RepID=A0A1I6ZJ16_9FLAO|nr:CopD family protein [Lishizhenia tianjinensis]SFT62671.1 putative membrane protein [Lishizhenia tianjinensis]
MSIQAIKALHIIFVISWFAGLFYIVRLFIYHAEAQLKASPEKEIISDQLKFMQRKLWYIITLPAMLLTICFGVWLFIEQPFLLKAGWMHVKLNLLVLLVVYNLVCHRIFKKFQSDEIKWSSTQLRFWNELATLFMVAIVFVVMQKDATNWVLATLGFFGVGVGLMIAIKLYKKFRKS